MFLGDLITFMCSPNNILIQPIITNNNSNSKQPSPAHGFKSSYAIGPRRPETQRNNRSHLLCSVSFLATKSGHGRCCLLLWSTELWSAVTLGGRGSCRRRHAEMLRTSSSPAMIVAGAPDPHQRVHGSGEISSQVWTAAGSDDLSPLTSWSWT